MAQPEPQTLRQVLAGAAGTKRMLWGGARRRRTGRSRRRPRIPRRRCFRPLNHSGDACAACCRPSACRTRRLARDASLSVRRTCHLPISRRSPRSRGHAIVTDRDEADFAGHDLPQRIACDLSPRSHEVRRADRDRMGIVRPRAPPACRRWSAHSLAALTGADQAAAQAKRRRCGARSTIFAAMAACRFSSVRCSAAPRSCFRVPASRSPIICSGWRASASPIFPARRRIGGAR